MKANVYVDGFNLYYGIRQHARQGKKLGLTVGLLNPHQNPSRALQRVASFYRPIRAGALMASQFPPRLRDANGTITKPPRW